MPVREQKGAESPEREESVEDEADAEQRQRRRAARLRHGGHERRGREGGDAECDHADQEHRLHDQEQPDAVGPAELRDRGQGEDRPADGQCRTAGEGDDAVVADQDPGRREAVKGEQGGHDRERGADENRPAVASPRANDG